MRDLEEVARLKMNQTLYCFDWQNSDLEIWGHQGGLDFAQIDVMAIPCHMQVTLEFGQFDI